MSASDGDTDDLLSMRLEDLVDRVDDHPEAAAGDDAADGVMGMTVGQLLIELVGNASFLDEEDAAALAANTDLDDRARGLSTGGATAAHLGAPDAAAGRDGDVDSDDVGPGVFE